MNKLVYAVGYMDGTSGCGEKLLTIFSSKRKADGHVAEILERLDYFEWRETGPGTWVDQTRDRIITITPMELH